MKRRAITLGLLFFQAYFLILFSPGHVRGRVTIPQGTGTVEATVSASGCCAFKATAAASKSESTRRPDGMPTREQRSRCAVCFVIAHLDLAPPVVIEVAALPRTGTVERSELRGLGVPRVHVAYDATAPPAV